MNRIWALFILFPLSLAAQTYSLGTGNYLASTAGMDSYPMNYFGNIGYDNLLAPKSSFQGEQHIYTVYVTSGTTTTFQDYNPYNTITANQLVGYTITRVCTPIGGSGVQAACSAGRTGYTGTITANTATNAGVTGAIYTVSPAASTAFSSNDLVTVAPPLSGLAANTIAGTGWVQNGGTCAFAQDTNTANLPPAAVTGLPQVYGAFQITTTGSCQIVAGVDTAGGPNIVMNGTTTFSATMNLISGSGTVTSSVARLGGATFVTGAAQTLMSGIHTYTWTGSASETAAVAAGNIQSFLTIFCTSCVVDMVPASATVPPVVLTGKAGGAPGGSVTPYAHTNPTVFSDQYVNLWKNANYQFCRMNYVYSDALAGDTLENLLQPYGYRQQTNTSQYNFGKAPGIPVGIEELMEFAAAAGCTKVESALPPSLQAVDYTHLMAFLGAPCTDSYGQIRCNLGHSASWFTSMKVVFSWNETWNSADTGAWLGGGVGALAYASIAGQAIKASPYYTAGTVYFNVPLTPGPAVTAYIAGYNPSGYIDGADVEAYAQAGTTTATQPAMYQAMLAEGLATTDTTLNTAQLGSQGFITNYETSEGSQNGACTVAGCTGLYSGLGAGLVEAIRVAAFQRTYPGKFQWWGQWTVTNSVQPYSSTAGSSPATTSDLWISCQNLRGAGAPCNGRYYATALYNTAAMMGNGINVSASGVPTFNFTAANGIPNESNLPLTDFYAFCNGTGSGCTDNNRSYLLANYDSVAHTFTIGGSLALSGTVTKTTYASTNATPGLNDNNLTLNAAQVVGNTVTTGAAASSYTVGPYAMALLQGAVSSSTGGWVILQ